MPMISSYYICPAHTAEWDTLRQGFVCAVCNHRWTEHDVPALLTVIDELKQCSRIAEAARKLELRKSLDGEKRVRELQKSLEVQRKLAETLNRHGIYPDAAAMTIHELSNEDLNRWIAEKLEPMESTYFIQAYGRHNFCDNPVLTVKLMEILKCQVLWSGWPHSLGQDGPMGWCVSRGAIYNTCDKSLSRAVAEAWALANGWKP